MLLAFAKKHHFEVIRLLVKKHIQNFNSTHLMVMVVMVCMVVLMVVSMVLVVLVSSLIEWKGIEQSLATSRARLAKSLPVS